jgi:hypothetical protein
MIMDFQDSSDSPLQVRSWTPLSSSSLPFVSSSSNDEEILQVLETPLALSSALSRPDDQHGQQQVQVLVALWNCTDDDCSGVGGDTMSYTTAGAPLLPFLFDTPPLLFSSAGAAAAVRPMLLQRRLTQDLAASTVSMETNYDNNDNNNDNNNSHDEEEEDFDQEIVALALPHYRTSTSTSNTRAGTIPNVRDSMSPLI